MESKAKASKVLWRLDIRALAALGFGFRAPNDFRPRAPPDPLSIRFVPNIASAKKNMRKTRAATVRNRAQRSALRTAVKKAKAADSSPEAQRAAAQLLDRAARKGLIHKNAAARQKSRIARRTAAA